MFFSKIVIALFAAFSAAPYVSAAGSGVSYDAVIARAASQSNGETPASLNAKLAANGGQEQIQTSLNKLGWGSTVVCPLTCVLCQDCATGVGNVGITVLAAFASAALACVAIVDCPAALAAASIASAAAIATFCNSQHQPATCADDCAWQVEPCSTLVVPVPTATAIAR